MFENFIETQQFGKRVVDQKGNEWHYVRSARVVPNDGIGVHGEYILAVPYGAEAPCQISLVFIPKEPEDAEA